MKFTCPGCGTEFGTARPDPGSWLRCPECGLGFRVPTVAGREPAAPPAPPPPRPGEPDVIAPGKELRGFLIQKRIGAGAMGDVYEAVQLSLNRVVVLKVLPKAFAQKPEFLRRFHEESRALSTLNHPNIVTIHERGNVGNVYFFAMEYVDGVPLARLQWDHTDVEQFVRVARGLVAALAYAHEHGVIHRDIKPGNVMLSRRNEVKVTDFGLAALVAAGRDGSRGTAHGEPLKMGTPTYMSPEQRSHPDHIDARSDIYSAGVVLYELATGTRPTLPVTEPPSEVCELADPRLDPIIMRCVEELPERRYRTASELLADVEQYAQEVQRAPRCPHCGKLSPVRSESCIHCHASLDDLFDLCPECKSKNRRDAKHCLYCGVDLERGRTLISEKVSMMLDQADRLRLDGNYPEALQILSEVQQIEGRVFEHERERAEKLRQRTLEDRDRAAARAWAEAERMVAQERFREAIEYFRRVPRDVRDPTNRIRDVRALQARMAAERKTKAVTNAVVLVIALILVLVIVMQILF
jgi:serine/threonine protein kinase